MKLAAPFQDAFRMATAFVCLFALGIELHGLTSENTCLFEAACRFLCYFTFWMNAIAAMSMAAPVVAPNSLVGTFLSKPGVRAAIAANLLVVGGVYHFLLSTPFELSWGAMADVLLHYITPALYIADWLLFVPRGRLVWRGGVLALLLPIGYGTWTLLYGVATQWSPYPFLETSSLAVGQLALNISGLLGLFISISAVLVLLDRIPAWRHLYGPASPAGIR